MFTWLFSLACVLVLVTIVGHGLWVVAAGIFKNLDSSSQPHVPKAPQRAHCPRCGMWMTGMRCRACDWPLGGPAAMRRPAEALCALVKQVESFAGSGVIDGETATRMLAMLADEQATLAAADDVAARSAAARQAADELAATDELIVPETVDEPAPPQVLPTAVREVMPARDHREFVSEATVRERAEQVMARRRQQAEPAVHQPPVEQPPPLAPSRTLTDWLAAFMEERNIRWGELIGGLLIVCGSIALVVSFWSAIAEMPLLKFLLFNGVTAGLFGVGFYSEHRWRLHTTSQGLLLIGSLLVPLNFLAIAAFSSTAQTDNALTIAGEILSVALFSALVYWAGKILVDGGSGRWSAECSCLRWCNCWCGGLSMSRPD